MALQRLNHRHEQIINWLLANPDRNLGECARCFGYTQAWLSQIIHSDMFQALYQERAKELGIMVVHSLGAKLKATADLTLDKIQERLTAPTQCSDNFLTDTSKNILSALGYIGGKQQPSGGDGQGTNHFHQHIHVDAQTLVQARERARALVAPAGVDGQAANSSLLPASLELENGEEVAATPLPIPLPAKTGSAEELLAQF